MTTKLLTPRGKRHRPVARASLASVVWALAVAASFLVAPFAVAAGTSTGTVRVGLRPAFGPSYLLEFQAIGLANGTTWGVLLDNSSWITATDAITLPVANGTYRYTVLPVIGYSVGPAGVVRVNGSNVIVPVEFSPRLYPIGFAAHGLPTNQTWSVTAVNATTGTVWSASSLVPLITLYLPNGTYDLSFEFPPGISAYGIVTKFVVQGSLDTGPILFLGPTSRPGPPIGPWVVWVAVVATITVIAAVGAIAYRYRRRPRSPVPDWPGP